jgi:signal transduction histidine kinase
MLGFSLAFIWLFFVFRKRIEKEQGILRASEIAFERRLMESTLQVEERERIQIAMDIHDELGTLINVMRLNMHSAIGKLNQQDRLLKLLSENTELIEKTADSMRAISQRISPPLLVKMGLEPSLKELMHSINRSTGILITFDCNLKDIRFEQTVEVNIYRIVQELINNILKHANASKIKLNMMVTSNYLSIDLFHDGIGISNAQVSYQLNQEKGSGLKSIQTRLNNLKGKIDYIVTDDGLAEIRLNIPI